MTLFEHITASPSAFIDWLASDKEAICIDPENELYAGIETSIVLVSNIDADDDEAQSVDAEDIDPQTMAELRAALMLILCAEVDEDGNPIDV